LAAGTLMLLVLAGGCTSSKGPSSPGPTPATPTATTQGTAEFCSDYEALKASLQHLATLNVIAVGTDGINAAVEDVRTKAVTLAGSAGVFEPQVTALTNAIDALQSTVKGLSANELPSALPKIREQIAAVGTAGQQLGSAVQTACPAPSGS
jgi:hypothetical protein